MFLADVTLYICVCSAETLEPSIYGTLRCDVTFQLSSLVGFVTWLAGEKFSKSVCVSYWMLQLI